MWLLRFLYGKPVYSNTSLITGITLIKSLFNSQRSSIEQDRLLHNFQGNNVVMVRWRVLGQTQECQTSEWTNAGVGTKPNLTYFNHILGFLTNLYIT